MGVEVDGGCGGSVGGFETVLVGGGASVVSMDGSGWLGGEMRGEQHVSAKAKSNTPTPQGIVEVRGDKASSDMDCPPSNEGA